MKKIITLCIVALVFSACQKTQVSGLDQTEISKAKTKGTTVANCDICSSSTAPVVYTGFTDPTIAATPGFGIYANHAYDAGWREGYQDALTYVRIFGGSDVGCNYVTKLQIKTTSGAIVVKPDSYVPQIGESIYNVLITDPCGFGNWSLVRCNLLNSCSPKALREQYQFNTSYTGVVRTSDQVDFDRGRYLAFKTFTDRQPYSAATP